MDIIRHAAPARIRYGVEKPAKISAIAGEEVIKIGLQKYGLPK
jgi:hypothetical protein